MADRQLSSPEVLRAISYIDEGKRERDPGRRQALFVEAQKIADDNFAVQAFLDAGEYCLAEPPVVVASVSPRNDWQIVTGGFKFRGKFYELTKKPLAVLCVFVDRRLQDVFSVGDLQRAWDAADYVVETSTVRTHVAKLNTSLKQVVDDFKLPNADPPIENRRNVGYVFKIPR